MLTLISKSLEQVSDKKFYLQEYEAAKKSVDDFCKLMQSIKVSKEGYKMATDYTVEQSKLFDQKGYFPQKIHDDAEGDVSLKKLSLAMHKLIFISEQLFSYLHTKGFVKDELYQNGIQCIENIKKHEGVFG